MNNYDLVSSLQALPETDPIEIDGIQFGGGGGGDTCQSGCVLVTIQVVNTVCAVSSTCGC